MRHSDFSSRILLAAGLVGCSAPLALGCLAVTPCTPSACVSMHPLSRLPVSATPASTLTGPLEFASSNMTLLSQLPLSQMGGGKGSSIYGWKDPLTQREYAIFGRSNGTAFIDITDPRHPKYVANLPMASGSSATDWREPKVYGNFAFIGVDGTNHPIQIIDLTKLRNYSGTTLTLTADRNFRGNGNTLTKAHTLAINPQSGFLYAARTDKYSGGIMAINVQNPLNAFEAGGFSGDGITHETQVVIYNGPDQQYRGREIAFNSNGKLGDGTSNPADTFSIVDITNKSNPTRLSTRQYAGRRYIHQGWLTDDHRYFFQNDEQDESGGVTGGRTRTHLWDVADLDSPIYRGFYDHDTTSIDHNLYVYRGYVFQTNYTTGLRVLKIGDLQSSNPNVWLEEVAFFDTYLPNDGQTFNGAWNNYPFFSSGNIIVSDIDGGLFVLRPDLPGWSPQDPREWSGGSILNPVPEPSVVLWISSLVWMTRRRRS